MQKYAKYANICKICKNKQKYAKYAKICKICKNMQHICKNMQKYAKYAKNMHGMLGRNIKDRTLKCCTYIIITPRMFGIGNGIYRSTF